MSSPAAVALAYTTLTNGTRFLRDRAIPATLAAPWPESGIDPVRARYLGNCLAELDRFLLVLFDALGPAERQPGRNAANRLIVHRVPDPSLQEDQWRLRALGRSRACLRYCGGVVRRSDDRFVPWMTAGWTDPQTALLQRYALGSRLAPGSAELIGICQFYDALAAGLAAR